MPIALSAHAVRSKLSGGRPGGGGLTLTELPRFVRDELGLTGLLLTTDLLAGADRSRLMQVLEAADKAACPVLGLSEVTPQPLADDNDAKADAAMERCMRVAQAAHWMGCSAFAVPVEAPDDEDAMDLVAERLKMVARRAEKLDLNLSIAPRAGLTGKAERVGELLKRIGGFRIGTLPDFATAAASEDAVAYLRRLVPYASMVVASGTKFEPAVAGKGGPGGKAARGSAKLAADLGLPERASAAGPDLMHPGYDLAQMAGVLVAVGFEGPIAIDYKGAGDPVGPILHIKGVLERLFSDGMDDDLLDVDELGLGELGDATEQ
jgi:sugar phosphate isomerase/epimerase